MTDPYGVEFVKPRRSGDAGLIGRLDRLAGTLASLEHELGALRVQAAQPSAARHAVERLAAMLSDGGDTLHSPAGAAFAARMAQADLLRALAGLRLPPTPAEAVVSLVLCGGTTPDIIATLRGAAPMLTAACGELLLATDGADDHVAGLGRLVRGLRVVTDREAVAAINMAVAVSRGGHVVLLRPAAPAATPRGLADMLALLRPDRVLVGRSVADSLARWGVGLGAPRPGPGTLLLAVPRPLWDAAGGLDWEVDDGSALAHADLCLKLRLMGARFCVLDGARAASQPPRPHTGGHDAAGIFRDRWGDIDLQAIAVP